MQCAFTADRDARRQCVSFIDLRGVASLDGVSKWWSEWLRSETNPAESFREFPYGRPELLSAAVRCRWPLHHVQDMTVSVEAEWQMKLLCGFATLRRLHLHPRIRAPSMIDALADAVRVLAPRLTHLQMDAPGWYTGGTPEVNESPVADAVLRALASAPAARLQHLYLSVESSTVRNLPPEPAKVDFTPLVHLPALRHFFFCQDRYGVTAAQAAAVARVTQITDYHCACWIHGDPHYEQEDVPLVDRAAQIDSTLGVLIYEREAALRRGDAEARPIRSLYFARDRMTPLLWSRVAQCTGLTSLAPQCWSTNLTTDQLEPLARFTQLAELEIRGDIPYGRPPPPATISLQTFQPFFSSWFLLTRLHVGNLVRSSFVSSETLTVLMTSCPILATLELCNLELQSLHPLAAAPHLRALSVRKVTVQEADDPTVPAPTAAGPPAVSSLTSIDLHTVTGVGERAERVSVQALLVPAPALTSLVLNTVLVPSLAFLAHAPRLMVLNCWNVVTTLSSLPDDAHSHFAYQLLALPAEWRPPLREFCVEPPREKGNDDPTLTDEADDALYVRAGTTLALCQRFPGMAEMCGEPYISQLAAARGSAASASSC